MSDHPPDPATIPHPRYPVVTLAGRVYALTPRAYGRGLTCHPCTPRPDGTYTMHPRTPTERDATITALRA